MSWWGGRKRSKVAAVALVALAVSFGAVGPATAADYSWSNPVSCGDDSPPSSGESTLYFSGNYPAQRAYDVIDPEWATAETTVPYVTAFWSRLGSGGGATVRLVNGCQDTRYTVRAWYATRTPDANPVIDGHHDFLVGPGSTLVLDRGTLGQTGLLGDGLFVGIQVWSSCSVSRTCPSL